jgi:regulator of sigma D
LYGGFDVYTNMKQKIEGQGDRDYSQIESILPTLNNVVKTNENVAKLAKDKLQKPDTIITDKNYVNAVDYLLKKIG